MLQWSLEWGGHKEEHLHAIADTADFIPDALLRKPELPHCLTAWLEAFYTAAHGRQFIVVVGADKAFRMPMPIPATEFLAVAPLYGLPELSFLRVARELDLVYLAHSQP